MEASVHRHSSRSKILLLLCILLCCFFAQPKTLLAQDTTQTAAVLADTALAKPLTDTVVTKHKKFEPDAKRAALYSSIFPGLGQLYNRQYWKLPLVYGILGTTVYFAVKHNNDYQKYRKAYISRLENASGNDEFQGILSLEGIKQYQDQAKTNRDMMIVYTVLGYSVQILEAISGAHLKNFDISKDLSLHVSPYVSPFAGAGFSLAVQMKR